MHLSTVPFKKWISRPVRDFFVVVVVGLYVPVGRTSNSVLPVEEPQATRIFLLRANEHTSRIILDHTRRNRDELDLQIVFCIVAYLITMDGKRELFSVNGKTVHESTQSFK